MSLALPVCYACRLHPCLLFIASIPLGLPGTPSTRRASTLSLVPLTLSCPRLLSATTSCWSPSLTGCWCLRAPQSIITRHIHQSQLLTGTRVMAGEIKRHAGRRSPARVDIHDCLHLVNAMLYIVAKLVPTCMQALGLWQHMKACPKYLHRAQQPTWTTPLVSSPPLGQVLLVIQVLQQCTRTQ